MTSDSQETPTEYAGDNLQNDMEDVATEAGHIVVDTGKRVYRTGKHAIRKFREKLKETAERKQQEELENGTQKTPADEQADPVTPDQPGPATPPESSVEEELVTPSENQQGRTRMGKSPVGDGPKGRLSTAKDGADAIQKEQQSKGSVKRKNQSDKSVQQTERAIKQAKKVTEQTAKTTERSVKGTQRAVKTAAQFSKVAIKRHKKPPTPPRSQRRLLPRLYKSSGRSCQSCYKSCGYCSQDHHCRCQEFDFCHHCWWLGCCGHHYCHHAVALIVGSCFGIFFSSEDTGSPMIMQSVVQEINMEYQSSLDAIRNMPVHDKLESSGSRAIWWEVLAIYAVEINTGPNNPQDVVSMDNAKNATLEEIFWTMNQINYRVKTAEETVIIEDVDEEGNIIETETTQTVSTLYINETHKTAMTMAYEHDYTEEQKQLLNELLQNENASMWSAVLYGIHDPNEQIVVVTQSQLGNVGGQPYWSWYGFDSRVEWCACFVSWCANECSYIDLGVIPKFAACPTSAQWFKDRGQWAANTATPGLGMIIFFDWDEEEDGDQNGLANHVGIVAKVEDGYVYTNGGNNSDSCVQRRYRIGYYKILGYGIPHTKYIQVLMVVNVISFEGLHYSCVV